MDWCVIGAVSDATPDIENNTIAVSDQAQVLSKGKGKGR